MRPSPRCGFSFLEVKSDLKARVAEVASSLRLHQKHVDLLGHSVHFAGTTAASAAACGAISRGEAAAAREVHRRWNNDVHCWSPATTKDAEGQAGSACNADLWS